MNNTLNRYSRINIETSMGLVLQRTHIGFPASLWVLTIPCHSRSEGSDSTMWSLKVLHSLGIHKHSDKTPMHHRLA